MKPLHLIKLCVGCDTVEELLAWRRENIRAGEPWIVRTKQTPRRAEELIASGSFYRVYKGQILSRQRILAIRTVGSGPAGRCEIVVDEQVVLTAPTPRRPFQGWRYLEDGDAPEDLPGGGDLPSIPSELARQLRELGAW